MNNTQTRRTSLPHKKDNHTRFMLSIKIRRRTNLKRQEQLNAPITTAVNRHRIAALQSLNHIQSPRITNTLKSQSVTLHKQRPIIQVLNPSRLLVTNMHVTLQRNRPSKTSTNQKPVSRTRTATFQRQRRRHTASKLRKLRTISHLTNSTTSHRAHDLTKDNINRQTQQRLHTTQQQ